MNLQPQCNLLLILISIVALVNFNYPAQNILLLLFMGLSTFQININLRLKMQLVSLLSTLAVLNTRPFLKQICSTVALGLALNAGYCIDLNYATIFINISLGISQIISYWTAQYLPKDSLHRDIITLTLTLPSLFVSYSLDRAPFKKIYTLNPYFNDWWQYSLGFIIGIYLLPLFQLKKHFKYLWVTLVLLVEMMVQVSSIVSQILAFLRGICIYCEDGSHLQAFLVWVFIIFKIALPHYVSRWLFMGYLILTIYFWPKRQEVNTAINRETEMRIIEKLP